MDDILVHGPNQPVHNQRLFKVLEKLEKEGITLNPEKCVFSKTRVTFLGNVIDQDGIQADPEKLEAIESMKAPTDRTELRRFLGMVNQMGKFSSSLAEIS